MPDICMCLGYVVVDKQTVICPKKELCYRYTATPDDFWQSYSNFYEVDKECTMFINNKERFNVL
jgi:hypothetical protein